GLPGCLNLTAWPPISCWTFCRSPGVRSPAAASFKDPRLTRPDSCGGRRILPRSVFGSMRGSGPCCHWASRARPRRMRPDDVRKSGGSDAAANFYPRAFSRTALDQRSEDGCACCIGSSGKPAKVIPANRAADDAVKNSLEWAEGCGRLSGVNGNDDANSATIERASGTTPDAALCTCSAPFLC